MVARKTSQLDRLQTGPSCGPLLGNHKLYKQRRFLWFNSAGDFTRWSTDLFNGMFATIVDVMLYVHSCSTTDDNNDRPTVTVSLRTCMKRAKSTHEQLLFVCAKSTAEQCLLVSVRLCAMSSTKKHNHKTLCRELVPISMSKCL